MSQRPPYQLRYPLGAVVNDLVMEVIDDTERCAQNSHPGSYGTECVSWSLDVSGGESVVVAGADSTTINNYQPSRFLWFLSPSLSMTGHPSIHPL